MIGSSEEQLLKLENDMKEKILIYRQRKKNLNKIEIK